MAAFQLIIAVLFIITHTHVRHSTEAKTLLTNICDHNHEVLVIGAIDTEFQSSRERLVYFSRQVDERHVDAGDGNFFARPSTRVKNSARLDNNSRTGHQ